MFSAMELPEQTPQTPAGMLQFCFAAYFQSVRPFFDLYPDAGPLGVRQEQEALAILTSISQMCLSVLKQLRHQELSEDLEYCRRELRAVFSRVGAVMDYPDFATCQPLGDETMCQMGAILEEAVLREGH